MSTLPMFAEEVRRADLDQWYTPPALADLFIQWAMVPSAARVLEPSAGNGAIVKALGRAGFGARLVVNDIDRRNADALERLTAEEAGGFMVVYEGDFLDPEHRRHIRDAEGECWPDTALMNPPYAKGADRAFLLAALDVCPYVYAIVRSAIFNGVARRDELWRVARLESIAFLGDRPEFDGPASPADGPMSTYCFISITRRPAPVDWRAIPPHADSPYDYVDVRWL